jgi:hypothetical protein
MGILASSSGVKCLKIEELSLKYSFLTGAVWFFIILKISVLLLSKFVSKAIKKNKKK